MPDREQACGLNVPHFRVPKSVGVDVTHSSQDCSLNRTSEVSLVALPPLDGIFGTPPTFLATAPGRQCQGGLQAAISLGSCECSRQTAYNNMACTGVWGCEISDKRGMTEGNDDAYP
jgi:hypothetical protein